MLPWGSAFLPARSGERKVENDVMEYWIVCRSLTYAQRSARALERGGISCRITRSPRSIAQEGCGYCVKVSERRLADALRVLRREGLGPKQVYLQQSDGVYREVET